MNDKCFAMRKNGACVALSVKRCLGYGKCPFYQPSWKCLCDQDKANARLRALPKDEQRAIADKYHNGNMPWREDRR